MFIKKPNDLTIYILGTMILNVLGSLSLWVYVPKYVCKVHNLKPFRDIKTIIKLFIPTIAIQVYTLLDKSMLGVFAPDYVENGYYEQAEKVTKICLTLVTSLGTVMTPRIGKTFKEGNFEKIKNYMYRSFNFIWFLAIPIMFGLIAVSSIFVPIFFGDGYRDYYENKVYLIPRYYSIGACIASVIAECCVTMVGFIYIHKSKELSIRKILKISINYFISGLVMLGILLFIKSFLNVSILSLAILIILGGIIYIVMLFLFKDKFFLEMCELGFNIVKKKLLKK